MSMCGRELGHTIKVIERGHRMSKFVKAFTISRLVRDTTRSVKGEKVSRSHSHCQGQHLHTVVLSVSDVADVGFIILNVSSQICYRNTFISKYCLF